MPRVNAFLIVTFSIAIAGCGAGSIDKQEGVSEANLGGQCHTEDCTCHGYLCDGKWPDLTGCNIGAYTVVSAVSQDGQDTVDLRYSPTCGTNWARAWIRSGRTNAVRIWRDDDDQTNYATAYTADYWPHYSPMVYAPTQKAEAWLDYGIEVVKTGYY